MTGEMLTEKLSFLAKLSETRLMRVVRGGIGMAGTLVLPASLLLLLAHFPGQSQNLWDSNSLDE